ncbi:MAG TPA: PQQ-binding-like beta-propeller repeat protein [Vicinamibacterales bacterium]|nr:PQQ-binding-like beta-propeller repeat protein [Vicinamibacterales bacterium]
MRQLLLAALFFASASSALAQDWAQWRGPSRDGVIPAAVIPKEWPKSTRRGWQVEVGEGYSSPVVANGRVFLHSRRDPEEIVTAIDLASGKVVWQQKYVASFTKNQYATQMAKGPNSTPLVVGSRLFTLGVTGVLTAWNITDGTVAWRQDYSSSIDTSKLFCGTAMSPMLEGDALIVQVGSDVHGGRVLALDPATGKERWSSKGAGPGYASPVAVTIDGVRQIITMTNGSIIGIDAANGAPLWSIPFPDEWHENIVTPIWTGSALIVSGTRQGTHAYAIARAGNQWKATQRWRNAEVTMYTVSPVFADGVVYGMSNKRRGQFVAMDAETGTVKWATIGRDGNHASIQQSAQHLLFLTDGGVLIVARRTPERFVEERRYEIGKSATWAQPVLLPDGMLVREATGIVKLLWE